MNREPAFSERKEAATNAVWSQHKIGRWRMLSYMKYLTGGDESEVESEVVLEEQWPPAVLVAPA